MANSQHRDPPGPRSRPGGQRRAAVTIEEIAADREVSVHTVRGDRRRNPPRVVDGAYAGGWPRPAGARWIPRGRPQLEYDRWQVAAFYKAKEALSPQARRGPKRAAGDWDPDERVDARTAASRLGITYNTVRSYPALYPAGSANPFPAKGLDGRYRWGDLEDWDDQRPGSGRHGPRDDQSADV